MKALNTGTLPAYIKVSLTIARILVGVLFIFSGVVKADDPLGLSYKMQEFFEAWGWTFLNDFSLIMSVLMIAFEIIAGVAVLLGWRMKLFSWLLLLLILFFTFLTSYVVFSGKIRACGCFGDCIPLTPHQTFTKDIILTLLIFFIFRNRNSIRPLFKPAISVVLLLAATLFAFASQAYMLKHLPVVDCLPWKPGKNVLAQMKPLPGSLPDSIVITFTYTKNGKEVKFISPNFPADFDESIYHLVSKDEKKIREGNDIPPIKDFSLTTLGGTDTTEALLSAPGYAAILFVKGDIEHAEDWLTALAEINANLLMPHHIPFYIVSGDGAQADRYFNHNREPVKGIVLKCDYVAIKTAARANPTLYLLKEGTIVNKWSYADFAKASDAIKQLVTGNPRSGQ